MVGGDAGEKDQNLPMFGSNYLKKPVCANKHKVLN